MFLYPYFTTNWPCFIINPVGTDSGLDGYVLLINYGFRSGRPELFSENRYKIKSSQVLTLIYYRTYCLMYGWKNSEYYSVMFG
jgi:hypothetical protein